MSFIKKEMMFEHVECKIDDENPKRKKGEKNVLTHAFFFFLRLNRTPILPHSQSVIIALKLYHDVRKSVSLTALTRSGCCSLLPSRR
jgi:hypothetical protein